MKTILLLAALALLVGCGSAVQTHTAAIRVSVGVHAVGGAVVDEARAAALDGVGDAHPDVGDERTAALRAEAMRWAPVGAALDAARSVLAAWLDVLEAVEAGAEDLWPRVPALVARLVGLWGDAVRLAGTLGVELPALPSAVTSLTGAL